MIESLRLFGKEYVDETSTMIPFDGVNRYSILRGYLVTPNACTTAVNAWLCAVSIDSNATFYKSWNDIISKTRIELLEDQLIHYATTYGTNFEGEPYIPNDTYGVLQVCNKLKVIDTITKEELTERIYNMLYSNIAMKQETIKDILAIVERLNLSIEIEKIANKEMRQDGCCSK